MEDSSVTVPLQPNRNGKVAEITTVTASAYNNVELSRQVDIQFSNVCYSVPANKGKWKEILRNVSGEFRSGHLTAILGPSGAGKTSFLNLLAKQITRNGLNNALKLNGTSYREQPEYFERLKICYVPQEFALMPLLTTRETIYVAARLKLSPDTCDPSTRNAIIENVAKLLGLQSCMDTLAGKLSGGERKRVSIAVEIITSPSLLLLDEPTSGLDSASSNQVISLLWKMARCGCTVVCTVHQPSSQMTCLFDDLLVLSDGCSRYCGPTDQIMEYFKNAGFVCPTFYNLAEFALEVVSGQRGGNYEVLCSKISNEFYADDKYSNHSSSICCKKYAVSQLGQMKILSYRAFLCISRDNTLTNLRIAAHLVVALLIGLVFYDFGQDASKVHSNIACVFFFAIFLFFANAMPAVQMFPMEASVFMRENANNWYSLSSYYIVKVLSDIPLQIFCPTGFLAIAYYMTGQPLEFARFFQVWLVCILFTILAQSFGIVIGAAFNTHIGMFLVPSFNIPMFLFAGFFLKLDEVPFYLNFLSSISYFRYVFEGILQAIYLDRGKLSCKIDFCYLRNPERILGELGMPSVSFSSIVLALISWISVLHFFNYIVLRWRLCLRSNHV